MHAFPNIQLNNQGTPFPTQIQNLGSIQVDAEWTYGIGTEAAATTDEALMSTSQVNTNVAIDMFLDADQTKSQSTTNSKYEIMVWIARYGDSTKPVGYDRNVVGSMTIDGTVLYVVLTYDCSLFY